MSVLTLIRHGATKESEADIILGSRIDTPLSELGILQATLTANHLLQYKPARIFSSPLRRAQQTASIIAHQLSLNYQTLPELRERDFGTYEGISRQQLISIRQHRGLSLEDPLNHFPPGLEGVEDHETVAARWRRVIEEIDVQHAEGETLLVTHNGFIRCALYSAWGLEDTYPKAVRVRQGSFIRVKLYPGNTLELHELWPNPITMDMLKAT